METNKKPETGPVQDAGPRTTAGCIMIVLGLILWYAFRFYVSQTPPQLK